MIGSIPLFEWILGLTLIASALGVISFRKPIYSSLSFLLTLVMLAALYLQLSAEFIAVMQILVYAGAILVIFVFVIILFQDAHEQISQTSARSASLLLWGAGLVSILTLLFLGVQLSGISPLKGTLPQDFGSVQQIGKALYLDFFFPFEAIVMLFLVAIVGALYIAKKEG